MILQIHLSQVRNVSVCVCVLITGQSSKFTAADQINQTRRLSRQEVIRTWRRQVATSESRRLTIIFIIDYLYFWLMIEWLNRSKHCENCVVVSDQSSVYWQNRTDETHQTEQTDQSQVLNLPEERVKRLLRAPTVSSRFSSNTEV